MSNKNLIVADVQSLEVESGLVTLYDLVWDTSTTLHFHPGFSTDVRIAAISGNNLTLNVAQTLTDGVTLTFEGYAANSTGSTTTLTTTTSLDVSNSTNVVVASSANLTVGMTVTGPGISGTDFSPIVFDGNTYYAMPISMSNIDVKNDGSQNRPVLTVANAESIIRSSSVFQNADGGTNGIADFTIDKLVGKRVTQRQTLEKYLTLDPSTVSTKAVVEYPKKSYVIDAIKTKTSSFVSFELASPFDLEGIRLPNRQVIGKYCPWVYIGRSFTTPTGACTWHKGGKFTQYQTSDSSTKGYRVYFTDQDEPIVWKYLIHGSPTGLNGANTHPGNTSGSFALDALVGLSDGSGGFTYWRSNVASNSTVPSSAESSWQQVRVYEPFISGQTYSTNSDDARRNEMVVYPVTNAISKDDTSFNFGEDTTVYRVTTTNNNQTPSDNSRHWVRADQCGKLLTSCKIRFQFKTGSTGQGHYTIPSTDTVNQNILPFGGFPGSRRHM